MDENPGVPRPTQISIYEEQIDFEEPAEELEIVRPLDHKKYEFDLNSIDVVGSPRLTRLFGFLTIEECDDIPDLDLAGDNLETGEIWSQDLLDVCSRSDRRGEEEDALGNELSTSTSVIPGTMKTFRIIKTLETWTKKWFQYEVYPFPTSQGRARFAYDFSAMYSSSGSFHPRMSKSQCREKLRTLKKLEHIEIIHLLNAIIDVADELYQDNHYVEAEIWFRRVVTTKQVSQLIAWYKPQQTLWACVQIVHCMQIRGRVREAYELHNDFHDKIERTLGADHDVTCFSRELKCSLLRELALEKEEQESLIRQHLQICLTTLGTAHPRTLETLRKLGYCLGQLKKHTESQHLLETTIHLRLQNAKDFWEIEENKEDILSSMTYLAGGLQKDMKYDECEKVLGWAQKLFGDAIKSKCDAAFYYHYSRASTYRLQEKFDESEKIIRGLLRYYEKSIRPDVKGILMWNLAWILMKTDREPEAAYWFKKEHILTTEIFGLVHAYTMYSCWEAGFCYAKQGRYHEARLFFGNVIEALTSSTEDVNSCMKRIQDINAWMLEVEEMRAKDPIPRDSVLEDSEMVDFNIGSDDYWREVGDVPDPCPLPKRRGWQGR